MTASRRRGIGLSVVIVLLVTLSVYTGFRLRVAAQRGWTGVTYIPIESEKHSAAYDAGHRVGVVVGKSIRPSTSLSIQSFSPGSIVFLYPGGPAERAGISLTY